MAMDHELITQTVQDYFGGWYGGNVARMGRALHPGLVKRSPAEDDGAILTKQVMLQACAGGQGTGAADRWLTVDIADVCGHIASAVVPSAPCRGHLRLIRTSGGSKTADALWPPR